MTFMRPHLRKKASGTTPNCQKPPRPCYLSNAGTFSDPLEESYARMLFLMTPICRDSDKWAPNDNFFLFDYIIYNVFRWSGVFWRAYYHHFSHLNWGRSHQSEKKKPFVRIIRMARDVSFVIDERFCDFFSCL